MSGRHSEFLRFLGEVSGQFGNFNVVARKQDEPRADQTFDASDLPITEVVADESHSEICFFRSKSAKAEILGLNLEGFHSRLRDQLEQHPEFSLMVSEWFQLDEEYSGRADMPKASR